MTNFADIVLARDKFYKCELDQPLKVSSGDATQEGADQISTRRLFDKPYYEIRLSW